MSLDTLQTINFAGKDGFQWFFAKVVPQEYWKGTADALNLDGTITSSKDKNLWV